MKSMIKPAILTGLALVLMIPLSMIEGVIRERSWNRDQVVNDIAESWTRAQSVSGPWLVAEYQVATERKHWDKEQEVYVTTPLVRRKQLLLRPVTSVIDGTLHVSHRYRGIFRVPVYSAEMNIDARFDLAPLQQALKAESGLVTLDKAAIQVGVTDARGFVASPVVTWRGTEIEGLPGTTRIAAGGGFHAPVDVESLKQESGAEWTLTTNFQLRGIQSLQALPAGYDSQVSLSSSWPHPSFIGSYLPTERTIDDSGFHAHWSVSAFSGGVSLTPETADAGSDFVTPGKAMPMGVRLYEPVDLYTLNERAAKYGALFIVVTFSLFWLTELVRRLSLHPVQYGLVGLALAIFFLLLLSLSEHIGFGFAYMLATTACVGLIGTYVRPLTGSRPAILLSLFLALLYAACYVILMLESHALLVGSILMFLLLAAVMRLTRHMDWYALTSGLRSATPQTTAAQREPNSSINSRD